MNCGANRRRDWDPALLWLWCRPAAAAPIGLLAWELPYAVGATLKNKKNKKIKGQKRRIERTACGGFSIPCIKMASLKDFKKGSSMIILF